MQNWGQRNWRNASAWTYLVICICDFILFPIVSWWFAYFSSTAFVPWEPLTLKGAGMLHLSFGALLTATSISKTKERVQGVLDDK